MEKKPERSSDEVPFDTLKLDLSKRTGKHMRLVLKIPKGGRNEG